LADPRRVAVVTTGRQDYGILRSSLMLMRDDPRFALQVWAGGMHLSDLYGRTIAVVRADRLPVVEELDFGLGAVSDACAEAARATAAAGEALRRRRPEALVLLGDRYETLAVALAATIEGVPIVHLYGGEESEGAIDNAIRHAITKLSHLHLVSHPSYAARVRRMGEDPARVVIVGAAGLDNLYRDDLPDAAALEARLGIALRDPVVVVTVHPTTLSAGGPPTAEVEAVAQAMEAVPASYVITQPNADPGGQAIRAFWKSWAAGKQRVALVDALGEKAFWGLLRVAAAALGNSSSGIIEAPAAGLPAVNVGDRQGNRLRSAHVLDVAADAGAITQALRRALSDDVRRDLRGTPGLYPAGRAARRIVEAIAAWPIPRPPRKSFHEFPA
jgi:UDP-hydrolysing UDP-N-acetyl-D-glucosamine 2-epimerase